MDCKTNALKNENIFIETDSKNIDYSINKVLLIIINQSKIFVELLKTKKLKELVFYAIFQIQPFQIYFLS